MSGSEEEHQEGRKIMPFCGRGPILSLRAAKTLALPNKRRYENGQAARRAALEFLHLVAQRRADLSLRGTLVPPHPSLHHRLR